MLFIEEAIEAYQTEYRTYPPGLARLVEVGLLQDRDLSFPWQMNYLYRLKAESFEVLRPLE